MNALSCEKEIREKIKTKCKSVSTFGMSLCSFKYLEFSRHVSHYFILYLSFIWKIKHSVFLGYHIFIFLWFYFILSEFRLPHRVQHLVSTFCAAPLPSRYGAWPRVWCCLPVSIETGSTSETCVPLQLPDQGRKETKLAGTGSCKAREGWKGFLLLISGWKNAKLTASAITML